MDEFIKALEDMNLEAVEKRLAEIEKEVRDAKTTKELEGMDEKIKALQERQKKLKELETRKQQALDLQSHKVKGNVLEQRGKEKMEENKVFDATSPEYRSAWLKHVRGLEMTEVEKRAFTSASSSAGAVIPTETANEILKKMKQTAPLLGEVTLLQVTGNVTFAIENSVADAAKHTENGEITASTDTLTSVTLGSYEINKLVQVSKTVATMSIPAFESWLTDMLAEKVSEQIGVYLITGTGSSQPTGIEKAQTWGDENSVTVAKTASLTNANVQTLIGLLNGGYDNGAKILMSKKTLYTDFMPLQDASKNAIVTVQGNNYYVYGYPVLLDDNVTVHEAYLGNFKKAIVANLSESINVVSAFDINTNSYKYLGSAMFDSKIAMGEAIVKLIKATA